MDNVKQLLIKSLIEDLNDLEYVKLKKALESNEDLKKEFDDYNRIKTSLENTNYSFNNGFSKRVMHKIASIENDLWGSFKSIAISSAAAIVLILLSIYFIDGSLNLDAIFGLHGYSVEEEFYSFLNI